LKKKVKSRRGVGRGIKHQKNQKAILGMDGTWVVQVETGKSGKGGK